MSRAEELRRRIVVYIEENKDPLVKAAFYSDERVAGIMRLLIERWERSGLRGVPLDYASEEELEVLAERAEHYKDMSREALARIVYREYFGG